MDDKKDKFRFIEKLLLNLDVNMARREILSQDLNILRSNGDVQAQRYEYSPMSAGWHSDPAGSHAERCIKLEQEIAGLSRITEPIVRMLTDLKLSASFGSERAGNMLSLYEVFYHGRSTPAEASEALHLDVRTIYNRRREIVQLAGEYLGL